MIRPIVVNLRGSRWDEYIGRAMPANEWRDALPESIFANPFRIERESERPGAIQRYRQGVVSNPALLEEMQRLAGKRLGCWCVPKKCHGDIIADIVEKIPDQPRVTIPQMLRHEHGQESAAIEWLQARNITRANDFRGMTTGEMIRWLVRGMAFGQTDDLVLL